MNRNQHTADAEGNVSANQNTFSAQPGVQPPPTSVIGGGGLLGEERIQGQNANNTRDAFPRKRIRTQLSIDERKFLLAVQRGDIRTAKRLNDSGSVDKNCVDPMGRTALVLAIINEDLPMVTLLISLGVEAQDALLHAISEEFVEAVELLLDHEETVTAQGQQHSWESLPPESRSFSSDITPLILAAHLDHFEIVRILLERGAILPVPHDIRCGCCDCITSHTRDSVHHSRSRMNAFRALASPSLICLTSKDPILSAFQLSWELRRLSFEEHEFRSEYQDLKKKCKVFATALLDHTRSSRELEIILNYDPLEPVIHSEGRMQLRRLRLAVKLHQKEFVTHPNVQQLLASIWYEGLPGFRHKNMFFQFFETVRIAVSFPILSLMYVMAPTSSYGQTLKKPFIKFICHSSSYLTFLAILIWASQTKAVEGPKENNNNEPVNYVTRTTSQRVQQYIPEFFIMAWLCGMIKMEVRKIFGEENLKEYVKDIWKVMDLGTTCLYVIVIILQLLAFFEVWVVKIRSNKRTQCWDPAVDAMVLSKCLVAVANIFSCLRMIYIFSVSQYLGPMQVSLSRMVTDMVRFFLLFMLVLFAFSCGLNQLLSYYTAMEKKKCCETNITATSQTGNGLNASSSPVLCLTKTHWNENDTWTPYKSESTCHLNITASASGDDCEIHMRFANLFEAMQTLFWTVFGVIDMNQFNLSNIESFTKFSAKTILGTYTVVTNVVLLNLLIAMLNNSYQLISGREDVEWKFARSKLWISYFDDKCTLPPPFNIFPTSKFLVRLGKFFKHCPCCKSYFFSKCCSCDSTPIVTSEPEEVRKDSTAVVMKSYVLVVHWALFANFFRSFLLYTLFYLQELLREQESNYEKVMHHLVGRYIMMSQQSTERNTVNEDDINELKQDISAFRCELIDVLQQSGYIVNAYCNAGLGGRKTRQRERRMMKHFDVIPTRENLASVWPGQPPGLQHVPISSSAPVPTAASKPATSVGYSALVALKKKRKKFFATSHKNRGSSDRQVPRAGSDPPQSPSVMQQKAQPFQHVKSDRQAQMVEGTLSLSTTNESVTTHSSDTFEASVESQEAMVPHTVREGI